MDWLRDAFKKKNVKLKGSSNDLTGATSAEASSTARKSDVSELELQRRASPPNFPRPGISFGERNEIKKRPNAISRAFANILTFDRGNKDQQFEKGKKATNDGNHSKDVNNQSEEVKDGSHHEDVKYESEVVNDQIEKITDGSHSEDIEDESEDDKDQIEKVNDGSHSEDTEDESEDVKDVNNSEKVKDVKDESENVNNQNHSKVVKVQSGDVKDLKDGRNNQLDGKNIGSAQHQRDGNPEGPLGNENHNQNGGNENHNQNGGNVDRRAAKALFTSEYFKKLLVEYSSVFIYSFCTFAGAIISRRSEFENLHPYVRILIPAVFVFMGSLIQNCVTEPMGAAHVNPVFTIVRACYYGDRWREVPGLLIAQFLAGLSISFSFLVIFAPSNHDVGVTHAVLGWLASIFTETLATALTTFVRLSVANDPSPRMRGFYTSLSNAIATYIAGPLSGASMNPFRSITASIASKNFENWYFYWIGPSLGAFLGSSIHKLIATLKKKSERVAPIEQQDPNRQQQEGDPAHVKVDIGSICCPCCP